AGGLGFVYLLDALLHVTAGRPLPEGEAAPVGDRPVAASQAPAEHDVGSLRYEVMFLLEAPDDAVPAFRTDWEALGDSIVVAGGDGLWNCHIHTDDIGGAVEAALERGRPRSIRVTDLKEQIEAERCASSGSDLAVPTVPTAVVAVAAGRGLEEMFRSLGAHEVVSGGQSMNPSAADLVVSVDAAPGEEVVVLPNNENVVAAAEQAGGLAAKPVRVVRTHSVPEGLAALLEYKPEAGAEDNAEAMAEAAGRVAWGEVAQAVRPSSSPAGPVREGDWLGISSRTVEVVAGSAPDAAIGLLERLVTDDHEIVTIIEGEGSSEEATSRVTDWLHEHHPQLAAEVHHGGQPLYPYLVSVE
ncbi:MAG: hypothetical protein M3N31_09240, partial [Actinomycetota bacterium]|nr:hypothetical protein [Actinomycetota bacterium]